MLLTSRTATGGSGRRLADSKIYSDMHTASRGSDSFSVQRMACTLQYDDYLFHSFSSSKDLSICILFYSGPNVHTAYCHTAEKGIGSVQNICRNAGFKKICHILGTYSLPRKHRVFHDVCMQLRVPMRGQLPCSEGTSPNPYEAWSRKKSQFQAMISVGWFAGNLEDTVVKSRNSDVVFRSFAKRLRPGSAKRYLCLATVVVGIFLEKTIPNRLITKRMPCKL